MRRRPFHGWVVVWAAFTVLLVAFSAAYSFAAFFEALQREFGATRAAVSLVFSIAGFVYFVLGAPFGALADRVGPRPVIVAGMVAVAAGLLAASAARSLTQIYLAYGLGIGLGVGLAYVPAVGAVQRWFVRRRGQASGFATTGIGVGTLLGPPAAAFLIAGSDWRTAYLVFGLVALVVGLAAAALIEDSPARRGLNPDGAAAAPEIAHGAELPEESLFIAIFSRPFLTVYLVNFVMSFALFVPFVHLAPFALDLGLSNRLAAILVGLIGLGSALGRFVIGGLADRFGRVRTFVAMFAGIAAMFVLWLIADGVWPLAVFALVFGTCYGGYVAILPAMCADYYGGRNMSAIIGALYTSVALGVLLGPTFAGWAYDVAQSYVLPIALSIALATVATIGTLFLPDPARWRARR